MLGPQLDPTCRASVPPADQPTDRTRVQLEGFPLRCCGSDQLAAEHVPGEEPAGQAGISTSALFLGDLGFSFDFYVFFHF